MSRGQTSSEQHTTQTRNSTPGSTIPAKSRTPPSLEKANKPQKRLNMEDNNMEIDPQTIDNSEVEENRSITRSNDIEGTTRRNDMSRPTTNIDETRSNKTLETTPRGDNRSGATRQNNGATGSNVNVMLETTRHNKEETRNNDSTPTDSTDSTEAIMTNPFETEDLENEGKTLEDLGLELAKMGRILTREITKSLSRALIPLQNEINDLKTNNSTPPSVSNWRRLKDENEKLHTKVHQLELNNSKLQMKLSRIKDKLVENNLLFFGINELEGETEQDRYSVILEVIASTFVGPTQEIRLEQAKNVMIESLTRKGIYNPRKIRPISVTFTHLCDSVNLLMNRKYLPNGVFVSKEYGERTENERKLLKPILRAANNIKEYKRRCRLEGDHLVIKGHNYGRENLSELPDDISGFKVTSKEDAGTVGFFGELNPLSNFHPCVFKVEDNWFHRSKQYIQLKKAEYFNDQQTALKILTAETAIECKQLAREIKNFDAASWNQVIEDKCFDGLLEKFHQNRSLNLVLQKTEPKTIVESSYDRKWGTGIPLHSPDALNSEYWTGDNLLGKMLSIVRDTLRSRDDVD